MDDRIIMSLHIFEVFPQACDKRPVPMGHGFPASHQSAEEDIIRRNNRVF